MLQLTFSYPSRVVSDCHKELKNKADMRLSLDLDDSLFEGLVYEGADLKAKSQWKRDLLAEQEKALLQA